jgi:isoaspartyl peptidase/L-asparaginase-like protein (Ntn-hydrolase superfamily)
VTAYEKAALEKIRNYGTGVESIFKAGDAHDTVGAVAFDGDGFSCCTSTGGVTFKRPGRVGDSPLAGSGGYADGGAACSTTGHGEGITKALLAHRVVWGCGADQTRASKAVDDALDFMKTEIGSQGIKLFDNFNSLSFRWRYMLDKSKLWSWIQHEANALVLYQL